MPLVFCEFAHEVPEEHRFDLVSIDAGVLDGRFTCRSEQGSTGLFGMYAETCESAPGNSYPRHGNGIPADPIKVMRIGPRENTQAASG
jgi:hypothetical protein